MAIEIFEREITFHSKIFDDTLETPEWVFKPTTKVAKFKILSSVDRNQHKLHGKILSMAEAFEKDEETGKMKIDSDTIYDLTVKAIKTLLVTEPNGFTEQDKIEFLNDSMAILPFGLWLLTEQIMPFFSKFKMT